MASHRTVFAAYNRRAHCVALAVAMLMTAVCPVAALSGNAEGAEEADARERLRTQPACTMRNSTATTITAILTEPLQWTGRCVRVEGVIDGVLISKDGDARYRMMSRENTPSSNGGSLGLEIRHSITRPTRARVLGRVYDCDSEDAMHRGPVAPISGPLGGLEGFCAMRHGLYLFGADLRARRAVPLMRRLPAQSSPDFGNLAPINEADPHFQRIFGQAIGFLDAVMRKDRAALRQMHIGATSTGSAEQADRAVRLILDDTDSAFSALRVGNPTVRTRILGWKPPIWAEGIGGLSGSHAEAFACFSTNPKADKLWPIDTLDADNRSGRPYACTRILIDRTNNATWARFETERGIGPAAVEPAVVP